MHLFELAFSYGKNMETFQVSYFIKYQKKLVCSYNLNLENFILPHNIIKFSGVSNTEADSNNFVNLIKDFHSCKILKLLSTW